MTIGKGWGKCQGKSCALLHSHCHKQLVEGITIIDICIFEQLFYLDYIISINIDNSLCIFDNICSLIRICILHNTNNNFVCLKS